MLRRNVATASSLPDETANGDPNPEQTEVQSEVINGKVDVDLNS